MRHGLGSYLVSKDHKVVFEQVHDLSRLVDSGMYSWIRHLMYLGILVFCLAFLPISFSLVSIAIWITFFIFYNKVETYEEKSLTEVLGDQYIAYQKSFSKWFPRI